VARYYLYIVIGSRRIPDQDGSDWPDAEAARQGALQEIRSLMTNRIVDMLETKD
jgi:Domain of unknown function (DUF6894)